MRKKNKKKEKKKENTILYVDLPPRVTGVIDTREERRMYTAATVTTLVFLLGLPRGSRLLDLGKTTKKRSRSVDGLLWGGGEIFCRIRITRK